MFFTASPCKAQIVNGENFASRIFNSTYDDDDWCKQIIKGENLSKAKIKYRIEADLLEI